eukprot:9246698-Lingulodinium_polyedra.AAC.1
MIVGVGRQRASKELGCATEAQIPLRAVGKVQIHIRRTRVSDSDAHPKLITQIPLDCKRN